jgi:hypothetical protein
MRKIIFLSFILLLPLTVSAQDIQGVVSRQLATYPESRLIDIYKSCFQDYMGAEHLVTDRQSVKTYLDEELATTTLEEMQPWYYEPCGTDGGYYRVSLRAVKEGIISADQLLDAFIRSAGETTVSDVKRPPKRNEEVDLLFTHYVRPSVESWSNRWHTIIAEIDKMNLNLPNYDEDKTFIYSLLTAGKYAVSHSPAYREAYHPHYRIVRRDIFKREIKPAIEKYLKKKNKRRKR